MKKNEKISEVIGLVLFSVACVFWMLTLYEASQDNFPSIGNSWWNAVTILWTNTTCFKWWIVTAVIFAIVNCSVTACFTLFICMPACIIPPMLIVVLGMCSDESLGMGFFSGGLWTCVFVLSLSVYVFWRLLDTSKEYINRKKEVSFAR